MTRRYPIVFLLDVDNTLLDNDHVTRDLSFYLERKFGPEARLRYWTIFERLRAELGYSDYLGSLQRYRDERPDDPNLLKVSSFLIDYPFANRLYPGSLDAIGYLDRWGPTVILSDGDVVFQPRKVERSGLWEAVEGRVLIYVHKEQMLGSVERHFPAEHYVMVDDKLRILDAMKRTWGMRLATVFPRQGHYATDPAVPARYHPPDLAVERIGDLMQYGIGDFLPARTGPSPVGRDDRGCHARFCGNGGLC
jgi:FMN phosphatase YigB (HAD superfamily)